MVCAIRGLPGILAMFAVQAAAQRPSPIPPRTIDDMACPAMPVVGPERMTLIVEPAPHIAKLPPASAADRAAYMRWVEVDPQGVCRYREESRLLPSATDRRIIFIGDSITESWRPALPALFAGDIVNRGVSGQTTAQMLARFRTDVLDLRPAVVHIMGGVNDIHGGRGTALTRSNIASMVELARAHGIVVILGAIPPSSVPRGADGPDPAPHIAWLNDWLRRYALENGVIFVDYHAALRDGRGGMKDGLSNDGLHPNRLGFRAMEPLARAAMDQALSARQGRSAADGHPG